MSNKCSLVIEDIKFILKSNNQNCNNYTFNCKNNYLCLKYKIFCVKVNYCLFTEYDIENKTPEYINYLRKKINELFDKVYKPKKQSVDKSRDNGLENFMEDEDVDRVVERGQER